MRSMRRVLMIVAGLAIAIGAALPAGASAAGQRPPRLHPPQSNYLALGDSLAFGFQEAKFLTELGSGTYSAASFDTGYDADFAAVIAPLAPGGHPFQETNYGCPGETTTSMVSGPCPFPLPLHNSYPAGDSQLQAAVSFLQAHEHKVNPITLDIGANDLLGLLSRCGTNAACVASGFPGVTSTMSTNLDHILTALQAAAPGAEIIAMNVPDPFEFANPASLQLFGLYNQALDAVVSAHNVRLVDAFSAVAALYPSQLATFCSYSAVCTPPLFDIHPTDLGYSVLAAYFYAASGYATLN
jgi:lysophospholipase L1-like esterase